MKFSICLPTGFEGLSTPEEHIAMAWIMEGGTRAFYDEVVRRCGDQETVALFRDLTQAEEHHQSTLLALYEGLAGRKAAADFPRGILADLPADQPMEGGARFVEAVHWLEGKQVRDILEYAIAIETAAYDRYLVLRRNLADENSRRVFEVLSDEEKRHLRKLTHFLDHFL
jgi:rubrerythrin